MKLSIVGGGGFRVPLVYGALLEKAERLALDEVVLHDIDPHRLERIAAVLDGLAAEHGERLPFRTTTELPDAVEGADYVFCAIRAGQLEGRVVDESVPLSMGVLGQETTGPGGICFALRTIPQMVALAEVMAERAPSAWLINFTNPAGMVTEALLPVLGRKVIGICDSAGALVQRAARAAGVTLPEGTLDGVGYYGLNHLGWLYRLESEGRDVLPALLSDPAALRTFEEGRLFPQPFLAGLGALPNEYLYYYYQQDAAREAMRAMARTRGETIHSQQQELYPRLAAAGADAFRLWDEARRSREEGYLAEARGTGEQRDEDDLAGGGYERVALAAMHALSGAAGTQLILNTRNSLAPAPDAGTATPDSPMQTAPQPAIPGLPADAVVEVPCTVTAAGALPLAQQAPPEPQLALLRRVKEVERLTVRAAVGGDRDAALAAFARHPLVDSRELAAQLLAGYEREFHALRDLWRHGGR
jgi:6-phospho-beta-glucosidase